MNTTYATELEITGGEFDKVIIKNAATGSQFNNHDPFTVT